MFVFIDYQVDSLVSEEYVLKGVSSVVSTSPPKVAEYRSRHKQYIVSLHGKGGDKRDAFCE
jgi:hypothetical protein